MPPAVGVRLKMQGGPLVLDAAMGTRLIAAGLSLTEDDPALWNLTHPEVVAAIHARDRVAGADVITTNTFGANRVWLARFGRSDQCEAINRRAVDLARAAAGESGLVFGDIGPTGLGEPGAVRDQARLLIDAGVDALLFETFPFESALAALEEVAGLTEIPRLVSLHRWPENVREAARRLVDSGADALGMNCRPGMTEALEFARTTRAVSDSPLLVRPSAVDPENPDLDAERFAEAVPRLVELGVGLIGGCCGTDDRHVAAIRRGCYAKNSRRSVSSDLSRASPDLSIDSRPGRS